MLDFAQNVEPNSRLSCCIQVRTTPSTSPSAFLKTSNEEHPMKDLGNLMKQVEVMQQKPEEAQGRGRPRLEGAAGSGLLKADLARLQRAEVRDHRRELDAAKDGELVADPDRCRAPGRQTEAGRRLGRPDEGWPG